MSSVLNVQSNPYGISPRTLIRCLEIEACEAHPAIKINQLENELDRAGLGPQDQALLNVLLAKLLLADPDNVRVDRSALGRGEEGAEVTIGRHPSTTALLRASGYLGLASADFYELKERIIRIAFKPTEPHLEEIYSTLVA